MKERNMFKAQIQSLKNQYDAGTMSEKNKDRYKELRNKYRTLKNKISKRTTRNTHKA
jgi:hypothetical protein